MLRKVDWRDVPFYSTISVGCISTELDAWLYNGTLYVSYEQGALTNARTFESLYYSRYPEPLKSFQFIILDVKDS
jgi:hypothetical protein